MSDHPPGVVEAGKATDEAVSPLDVHGVHEVIDSQVDVGSSRRRMEGRPAQWDVLLAIAAGGVVGGEARYGVGLAVPHRAGGLPWSTLAVNVTGCLLIGALMVVVLELTSPHRLARPFLGVGLLGGYTTYSTFAVDVQALVAAHRPLVALAYVAVTVVSCAIAVRLSTIGTLIAGEAVIARRRRHRDLAGERR